MPTLKNATIPLQSLPLADLMLWLNDNQLPEGDTFLAPNSVGASAIASSLPWIAPTIINSFANAGGAFETAGYLKDQMGFVHLKGSLITGASGNVAFILPAGFRPGATVFSAAAGGGPSAAAVQVPINGFVTCFYSAGPIGLSGITFLAEN